MFLCGFDYCYGVLVINDTNDLRYASVSIETVQRITYFIKKGTDRNRRREKVNYFSNAHWKPCKLVTQHLSTFVINCCILFYLVVVFSSDG